MKISLRTSMIYGHFMPQIVYDNVPVLKASVFFDDNFCQGTPIL